MGQIVSLLDREQEPAVVALLAASQIHRGADDARERAPAVALEYATNETYALWGFEDEGGVIGVAGLEWSNEGWVRLMDFAVTEERRREGAGRALIDHVRFVLQPLSVGGVTLAAAVPFFEALGLNVEEFGLMPSGETRYRFRWSMRIRGPKSPPADAP
jgi:GNAT superfamily N-acetyltransferase